MGLRNGRNILRTVVRDIVRCRTGFRPRRIEIAEHHAYQDQHVLSPVSNLGLEIIRRGTTSAWNTAAAVPCAQYGTTVIILKDCETL